MNAQARLFVKAPQSSTAAKLLGCVAVCALVSGCLSVPLPVTAVDSKSPIAAEVAKLSRTPAAFPKFSDIPPVPKDVRPKPAYGTAASQIEMARADIERATAPETWTLKETDRFAGDARAATGPDAAPVDPAATEAFARELRRRATPPPSPKR